MSLSYSYIIESEGREIKNLLSLMEATRIFQTYYSSDLFFFDFNILQPHILNDTITFLMNSKSTFCSALNSSSRRKSGHLKLCCSNAQINALLFAIPENYHVSADFYFIIMQTLLGVINIRKSWRRRRKIAKTESLTVRVDILQKGHCRRELRSGGGVLAPGKVQPSVPFHPGSCHTLINFTR
jgi:hypothetical protein